MTTAVRDHLKVSLSDAHEWLRLDPDLEATLVQASSAGAVTHKVSDLTGLRPGKWVTIGDVDAKIAYVDYVESNVVVDRVVSVSPLSELTPVSYFHQNSTLMAAIEAAKAKADEYLNNPFIKVTTVGGVPVPYVEVPPEVKIWVLSYVAYLYASPEVGMVSHSLSEAGSTRFDNSFETLVGPIRHLRLIGRANL